MSTTHHEVRHEVRHEAPASSALPRAPRRRLGITDLLAFPETEQSSGVKPNMGNSIRGLDGTGRPLLKVKTFNLLNSSSCSTPPVTVVWLCCP